MNETIKAVGGGVSADPVVSAVLNAVGKRYLVEKGSEDDGSEWEVYSDGFCVQRGIRPVVSQRQYTITLPKPYRDANYFIMAVKCDPKRDGSAWIGTGIKTTTSFSFRQELVNGQADNGEGNWITYGYLA